MMLELIVTVVLAVSTVFYTYISYRILIESKATRMQKTTPFIIAYLKMTEDDKVLCVYIKNVGEGCAKNVKIKILKDYNQFQKEGSPLSECMSFKNGVDFFPSQHEFQYYIDLPNDINYDAEDNYIELEIEYSDMKNRRFKNNIFRLPFNQIGGNYTDPPESYIGQIPYYLKKLNATVKGLDATIKKSKE